MRQMPRDRWPDATLALLRDGYLFLSRRRALLASDVFATRLLLQPAICIGGPQAPALLYDTSRFRRAGALPLRVARTLLGQHGVHSLDDETHHHRKAVFMAVMGQPRAAHFQRLFAEALWRRAAAWQRQSQIVLMREAQAALCEAACAFAGVPLASSQVAQRAADLSAMVDGFAAVGPRYWRGRLARIRCERWAAALVDEVRAHVFSPPAESALAAIAWHRDLKGDLLEARVAAVELLNAIRPAMAIAYFIVFAALALYEDAGLRARLCASTSYLEPFVHEVRRYYPFTPCLGAITRHAFDWQGYRFPSDTLVVLDVYGVHHDARLWPRPGEFRPERFIGAEIDPFHFLPQGGGNYDVGHRCAGEWMTIEALKCAVTLLVNAITYQVPAQDLSYSLHRIPTYPRSGVVLENVRVTMPAPLGTAALAT